MKADADVIRQLIHDENAMINHRMNWFLILQGFMFAGIAFAWDKNSAMCIVFSCVGMLSALSVGVLLRCGILAIKNLEKSVEDAEQRVTGRGSRDTSPLMHFLLPWHFLPVLMILSWATLIYIRIFNVT